MSLNLLRKAVEAAVNRLKQDAKGAFALREWIGEGALPVEQELAEQRSDICSRCPQNVRKRRVEEKIAETIRRHEEARSQINLRTSNDINLNTCESCGCYLKLKVWVPIENQTEAKFPPHCWVLKERTPKPVTQHLPKNRVSICRSGAFGDVIMASIIASKLKRMGMEVGFKANEHAITCLHNHPHIDFHVDSGRCDVELDGCYETHPERTSKDISLLMLESAVRQLAERGFPVPDVHNRVPNLGLTVEESLNIDQALDGYPKPWTVFIPKSASWPNRSVSDEQLSVAASLLGGTCFWAFPSKAPETMVRFEMRKFRDLMALISRSDLVVTPDTGPLHISAAFNRKVVYLETCNRPNLRVTDLTDYTSVASLLDCVGCGQFKCPINEEIPPCREIPGHAIGHAANQKLDSLTNNKVSAIIPVYRYEQRLHRAIDAVRHQVDEIVVVLDGNCSVPDLGPKVRVIRNEDGKRRGYGKTCNRGVRHSIGQFLLMLNDDCYLNEGAVQAMRSVMSPKVAVVGAQLWYPDGTIQHGGTGRNRGDIGFGHLDHKKTVPSVTAPRPMESVTFAAALVRRSAFYDVRGFDERYDCYSEDADFCMKVRQIGMGVMYQPYAVGIHEESQSTSALKAMLLREGHEIFKSKWEHFFRTNPAI